MDNLQIRDETPKILLRLNGLFHATKLAITNAIETQKVLQGFEMILMKTENAQ
jgi:hypothetical protein